MPDVYVNTYTDVYGGAVPLITLAEVKANLNYPNPTQSSSDDAEIQGYLDAALDVASYYVGPLAAQTYTETHYGLRSDRIVLDNLPVLSVLSVSVLYALGAPAMAYTTADVTVDPAAGVVRFTRALPMAGDITVTYTAGPSALTPSVRLGVLELVSHWYQRSQEGSLAGGGGIGQGYDAVDQQPGVNAGVPYSVLDKFRAHYRLQGIG